MRRVRCWHIHLYRFHHTKGANVYMQCRCGVRRWRPLGGGYSPVDYRWLESKWREGSEGVVENEKD